MSPSCDLSHHVGHNAFLEALDDLGIRVCILDKVPATMDDALCIVLNLQVLNKTKEAVTRLDWIEQGLTSHQTRDKNHGGPD